MNYNVFIAALTVWREARGESLEGQTAVADVILNRAIKLANGQNPIGNPEDFYYEVCTAAWQFSSITAKGDQQLGLYPKENDPKFITIINIVNSLGSNPDVTHGATHYFNPHVVLPEWAKHMTKTTSIGNHDFYK